MISSPSFRNDRAFWYDKPCSLISEQGDLPLIITERVSFSLSLKREFFRHKNWGHLKVKIIAWIFWKMSIFKSENHLKKLPKFYHFDRKIIFKIFKKSHKNREIIYGLRFFPVNFVFLWEHLCVNPLLTPIHL